jgi:hypothetical protein
MNSLKYESTNAETKPLTALSQRMFQSVVNNFIQKNIKFTLCKLKNSKDKIDCLMATIANWNTSAEKLKQMRCIKSTNRSYDANLNKINLPYNTLNNKQSFTYYVYTQRLNVGYQNTFINVNNIPNHTFINNVNDTTEVNDDCNPTMQSRK